MLRWENARSPRGDAASPKDHAMNSGTVKFFNTAKGFGFIAPVNGGGDAFVHISELQRSGIDTLHEGDKVTYDLETGRDGRASAVNLQRA
jgi:CspA family cold shock protein